MNTETTINTRQSDLFGPFPSILSLATMKSAAGKLAARIKLMQMVRVERSQLASMSDLMLKDIGLDPVAANQEAVRFMDRH